MTRNSHSIPGWLWLVVLLVVAAQAVAFGLLLTGRLEGRARNVVPQVLLAGLLVLILLAAHGLRYHPEKLPRAPARLGIVLLIVTALVLASVYVLHVSPLLLLRYDLGSWSEPLFILDIIKLRTGTPLYLPPDDSNTNPYTFAAPAVSYLLAWVLGNPTSIPLYRLIQQFYLVVAALFAAAAAWQLVRLVAPERFSRLPRIWLAFFALASFLFATNSETASLNVYLYNEPLALLASALAFWLMVKHAVTREPRCLWAMAFMPALAFLVKQYLVVWAAVYVVYLWFDGGTTVRRVLAFAGACLVVLGVTIGLCLALWGEPFYYWAFHVLSTFSVSLPKMVDRFVDAGWYIALGLLAGGVLLRGQGLQRFLGIWIGWMVLVLGGIYGTGTAPYTVYLGSATIVAACFFLAALAMLWPDEADEAELRPERWVQLGLGVVFVIAVFAGLGHPRRSEWKISPDLSRYVREIEREFDGLPPDRVLLDLGDWIYLRHDVVMKDRAPLVATHRKPHYGLITRVREQKYARILVHNLTEDRYLYDLAEDRGIRKELLANYREVRRIAGVEGMRKWRYAWMTTSDISVLEPIPRTGATRGAASAPISPTVR